MSQSQGSSQSMSGYAAAAATAASAALSFFGGQQANAANAASSAFASKLNYEAAMQGMNFNAEQAQQARNFADTELGKEQLFNQNQSQLARDWAVQQQQAAMAYNSAEAGRARAFADQQLGTAINANSMRAEEQQRYEAAQAQINRNFQWEMSSSAYRRMVDDMREAGLNPILGVNSGGAAGAPGSMPSVGLPATGAGPAPGAASVGIPSGPGASSPGVGTPSSAQAVLAHFQPAHAVDVIGPAVSNALAAYRGINEVEKLGAEVDNLKKSNDLIRAQTNEKDASTATLLEEARLKGWNMEKVRQEIANLQTERLLKESQVPLSKAETEERLTRSGANVQQGLTARQQELLTQTEREQREKYGPPGFASGWVGTMEIMMQRFVDELKKSLGR